MVNNISDIKNLIKTGFTNWGELGNVTVKECDNLRLFSYTAKAQYEGRWNFLERVSRGLILDAATGEVVARPFDKFFNFGEGDRYPSSPILNVTEKMDGSLGILYRWQPGKYRIATRGSFDSDQALWATSELIKGYDLRNLPNELTLLFEIIYPENRIVVDYQGKETLVLLAARNRFSGEYLPFSEVVEIGEWYGFLLPQTYQFEKTSDLMEQKTQLDANSEGWVAEFTDGQRFKFKGDEYVKVHRIIHQLSFKNTLEHMAQGTLYKLYENVPDEFFDEIDQWVGKIYRTIYTVKSQVKKAFDEAPKQDRKTFALWVTKNHKPLAPYLFAMLDSKDIEPLIFKMAFKMWGNIPDI